MQATAYDAASGPRDDVAFSSMIHRFIGALLCVLLLFAALFLLARRWADALTAPLSFTAILAVAVAATATAEALERSNRQSERFSANWLVRLALPILALAISLPGSSVLGLLVLWLIVVGEELRLWRAKVPSQTSHPSHRLLRGSTTSIDDRSALADLSPAIARHDPNTTQHISYRNADEGSAVVEGWLRADFAAGQRTAIVHVAFCPPFSGVPQVETEPLEGPACEVRPTLVLPWGVRWELRRAEPATDANRVVLQFFATGTPGQPAVNASGWAGNSM